MSDAATATADPGAGAAAATAAAAAAGSATDGTGAGGGTAPAAGADFLSQVPEEIRREPYFKDLKDVPALALKAYYQAKLIGRDPSTMLVLPGADAKPEEWGNVYDRLGRPAAPDKYALADPAALPPGLSANPEAKAAFAAKAHELGLSHKQAAALNDYLNTTRIAGFQAAIAGEAEGLKTAETTLKGELGAAFERQAEDGNLAVDHYAAKLGLGPALSEALANMPAVSRMPLFKMLAAIGATLREDGTLPGRSGDGGGFGAGLTPAQAMQQRAALYADKEFMTQFRSPNREIRQAAIGRMQVLNEAIAAGSASAA